MLHIGCIPKYLAGGQNGFFSTCGKGSSGKNLVCLEVGYHEKLATNLTSVTPCNNMKRSDSGMMGAQGHPERASEGVVHETERFQAPGSPGDPIMKIGGFFDA
jgi:hypothetical protein